MSSNNATLYRLNEQGNEIGVFVAEVDGEGRLLRSNWLQFTGLVIALQAHGSDGAAVRQTLLSLPTV